MASRGLVKFDKSRIPCGKGCDLSTPEQKTAFLYTARDYMTYVRSNPESRLDWDEEEEVAAAKAFIAAACVEDNWPLACQGVYEFNRSRAAAAAAAANDPPGPLLAFILNNVEHMLPSPTIITLPEPSKAEEAQNWTKMQGHLRYMGHVGGLVDMSSEDRRQEVASAENQLADIVARALEDQNIVDPTNRPRKHRPRLEKKETTEKKK